MPMNEVFVCNYKEYYSHPEIDSTLEVWNEGGRIHFYLRSKGGDIMVKGTFMKGDENPKMEILGKTLIEIAGLMEYRKLSTEDFRNGFIKIRIVLKVQDPGNRFVAMCQFFTLMKEMDEPKGLKKALVDITLN